MRRGKPGCASEAVWPDAQHYLGPERPSSWPRSHKRPRTGTHIARLNATTLPTGQRVVANDRDIWIRLSLRSAGMTAARGGPTRVRTLKSRRVDDVVFQEVRVLQAGEFHRDAVLAHAHN